MNAKKTENVILLLKFISMKTSVTLITHINGKKETYDGFMWIHTSASNFSNNA